MEFPLYTLPAGERIKSRDSLNKLFAEGKGGTVYPLRYIILEEQSDTPGIQVMVSVSKRNHKKANVRNLLKRRMREAFRLNKLPLKDFALGHNKRILIGIIYISKEILDFRTISDATRKIISKITRDS